MLRKQVQVVGSKTTVDGGLRITIDVLNASSEDAKLAFDLQKTEATVILFPTENIIDVITQISKELLGE